MCVERVTFCVPMGMVSSPGLDYISHEEVLPYTSTDTDEPFRHELFDQFLVPSADETSESNLGLYFEFSSDFNVHRSFLPLSITP